MAIVKLNLSGHENAALSAQGFIFPGTIQVDLADPQLPEKTVQLLAQYMGSGDTVHVALPGLAGFAAIVLVAIHGLTGHFPVLVPLVRGESGFVPAKEVNLQEVRNNVGRVSRQNVVRL